MSGTDSEDDALSDAWKTCGICDNAPKGSISHYDLVHKLGVILFKPNKHETYEMVLPWIEEGYFCPVCNGRRNSVRNMQNHVVRDTCKRGFNKEAWLHDQLHNVQTCEVTYKGGYKTTLEREGGSFWCVGCGLGSPFPGTMQFHSLGCECVPLPLARSHGGGAVELSARDRNVSSLSRVQSRTDEDQDMDLETLVSPNSGDISSLKLTQHEAREDPADSEGITPVHECVPQNAEALVELATARGSLAECDWEPCLPDTLIHAFVQNLPIPRRSAYNIFNAFANCGIETPGDLDILTLLMRRNDQAQRILMKRGVNYVEWLVVRHAALNRGSTHVCPEPDNNFNTFLASCVPPLSHRSAAFHDLCLHALGDVQILALLSAEWPHLQEHLFSRGLTMAEWLGLRHRLRSLSGNRDEASTLSIRFGSSLAQPLPRPSTLDVLKHVGLRSEEDIDSLCMSPLTPELWDEVLDTLSREGLSYSDCKAVEAELKHRMSRQLG